MAINRKALKQAGVQVNALYFLWVLYNGYRIGFRDIGNVQGMAML